MLKFTAKVLFPCIAIANFVLIAPITAQYSQYSQSQNPQTQYAQAPYSQPQYPQAQGNVAYQENEQVGQSGQNTSNNNTYNNTHVPVRNNQPTQPARFVQQPQQQRPLQNRGPNPNLSNSAAHVPNRNFVPQPGNRNVANNSVANNQQPVNAPYAQQANAPQNAQQYNAQPYHTQQPGALPNGAYVNSPQTQNGQFAQNRQLTQDQQFAQSQHQNQNRQFTPNARQMPPQQGNGQGIQQVSYPVLQQTNGNRGNVNAPQNRNRLATYRFEDEKSTTQFGPQNQLPPLKRVAELPKDAVSQTITLTKLNGLEFRRKLVDKLGSRCVPILNVNNQQNIAHYQMRTAENTLLDLLIDMQNNTLRITGSKNAVVSFANIAKLLDTREVSTAVVQTDVVPFQHANYRAVRRTINAVVQGQEETANAPRRNGQQNGLPNGQQNGLPNGQQPGQSSGLVNPVNEASAILGQMAQSGLIGPVQLEVIDGLDLVVIKGDRRDVAIVKSLIDQIERTAAEQEPEIVIHPMKNTDCSRVGTLVRLLYNEIYGTRRGSINITPLVKPNALLLVGKKESIETAIKLIDKLDVPVDPTHEFRIIHLKNASSDTVATMVNSFYQNRLQLGTQVLVVSDYRTNSLIVQASIRDMDEVIKMIKQLDADHGAAVNEIKVFPLLNANASSLSTVLQSALTGTSTTTGFGATSQSGQSRSSLLEFRTIDTEEGELLRSGIMTSDVRVTADTNGNQLIVSAPKDSMPLIESLIKQLDQLPAAESQIRVFTIVNGDASTLYTMLQNLFQTTTSGGGFGGTGTSSNGLTTLPGTADGESAMVQLRFYYDVRTNSIMAIGTEGNLAVVEALLMKLDEEEIDNRIVTVFRLLNSPASEIASAINSYLTQERQIETTINNELFSTFEQFRREVVVVEETVTNSLIVTATPRFYGDIRRIIKELDDRPPMVVIQVLIAEVSLDNMNEFGVELGLQDSILFNRSVDGVPGFDFNNQPLGNNTTVPGSNIVGTQGLTHLNVGRKNSDGSSGFVFSASSESVSVLIRALEERHKVNILSRPQVNALDNQRASIQVGENVPYAVREVSNNINSGDFYSVDWVPVGVILDVTPRINADGVVSMSIYAEKSKHRMIEIATDQSAPQITLSRVQTVVSALDGQTIVIGGLISNETQQTIRAVPFLSRIPVLGRLFEYRGNNCTRQELLIIMTPMIVRSQEDMEMIMNKERQRMHWCATDIMGISDSRNIRKRGDDYRASETVIVPYNGQRPTEDMLPGYERVQEQMIPRETTLSPTQNVQELIYEEPVNTMPRRNSQSPNQQWNNAQPRTAPIPQ